MLSLQFSPKALRTLKVLLPVLRRSVDHNGVIPLGAVIDPIAEKAIVLLMQAKRVFGHNLSVAQVANGIVTQRYTVAM